MSTNPEKFGFVPPTMPESGIDPYAHLRVEIAKGEQRFDMNPFEMFEEIGSEMALIEGVTAEDIVVTLQNQSGRSLNTQGIRNLLGWANEEISRQRDSAKLQIMTPSQRIRHLYGVDIIFDDPEPKEVAG